MTRCRATPTRARRFSIRRAAPTLFCATTWTRCSLRGPRRGGSVRAADHCTDPGGSRVPVSMSALRLLSFRTARYIRPHESALDSHALYALLALARRCAAAPAAAATPGQAAASEEPDARPRAADAAQR